MPTLVENGPVETTLPAPLGRHVRGFQVFYHDRAKAVGKLPARPVVPVGANAGPLGSELGDMGASLRMSLRAPLSSRQDALGAALTALEGFKAGWNGDQLSGAERQRVGHASINADRRRNVGRGVVLDLKAKRDMPSIRRKSDRRVYDFAFDLSGVAIARPADLRQPDFGPLAVQLSRSNFTTLETKAIVPSALARRWMVGNATEPSLVGSVQVTKGLHLTSAVDSGDPIIFRAEMCQFSALARKAHVFAGDCLEVAPVVPALFKREIVDQPTHPGELPEEHFLVGGRSQPIAIAALNHPRILGVAANLCNGRT